MVDALKFIVTSIVDNPDKVEIKEAEEEGITNFVIKVAKEDMGKVIGKEGKVIRAIRNVMKIPAIKQDKRIQISLEEETS
ncbi:MAG: KH domain-containing protein [Patescibacteria group bacterium]